MTPASSLQTVSELSELLSSGDLGPRELLESRAEAIDRYNGTLNAFITVFRGDANRPPARSPLRGITVAVKDNIFTKGHRTTAGSKILGGFVPPTDAEVVSRLKAAGAFVLGKTNLHEFAFGVTNINSHFGDCRNPWDQNRISGGSSGGSAVAVARGMACFAIGTDTAGSVRIPAALCGVVGYKPTYGLIDRRDIIPLAWSLDTVGLLTRSVEDAAVLAAVAAGKRGPVKLRPRQIRGLKIGVPWNMVEELDEDVRRRYDEALAAAESAGARLVRFKFLHLAESSACRSLIVHAEAASYHRQYVSTRYGDYGADLRKRLAQGLAIPAAVYLDAQRVRRALFGYYRSIFGDAEVIALPTTRIPAPTFGASKSQETAEGVRTALLSLTEPFNLFGAPAITIPCGLTREGLPVGLQIGGDFGADDPLLSAALSLEKLLPRVLESLPLR